MKIFGYGSLLCEDSFKKTISEFETVGVGKLDKYKRVFNFKSEDRKNPETGMCSSALNIIEDEFDHILGVVYEIPDLALRHLREREKGYDFVKVELANGDIVSTFIARNNEEYGFVFGDPFQHEYLDICLDAAKRNGKEFFENFLHTTYINGVKLAHISFKR